MRKRRVTIVVDLADDEVEEIPVNIGSHLIGGKVIGIATYDVMHTMEIAEAALASQNHLQQTLACHIDECIGALEEIEDYSFAG